MKIGKEFKNFISGKDYFLEVEESLLRQFFEVENKYTQTRDFRNKVLVKYAEEINKGTDLSISFEESIKRGFFTVTLSRKTKEEDPSKISLSDFKLTKQKKSKPSKPKVETTLPTGFVASEDKNKPNDDDSNKSTTGEKPVSLSDILASQHPAKEKKNFLSKDEINQLVEKYLNDNPNINLLTESLISEKLISSNSAYSYFCIILMTINSRYGEQELRNFISSKTHKVENVLQIKLTNKEAMSLSDINSFTDD